MKTRQTKPEKQTVGVPAVSGTTRRRIRDTVAILPLLLVPCLAGSAATTRYVWQSSPSPAPPFTTWATAAHTIQDAVDAAVNGDTVLVSGGIYDTGGRAVAGLMTNRVVINKPITVKSLMGPEVTLIVGAPNPGGTNGDGAIRCAYVGVNAVLSGFTLTNGHTVAEALVDWTSETRGGGAWCETSGVLTNCLITGNSAANDGGGGYGGYFYWCTLANNFSARDGGAVDHGTLYNCTLTENRGRKGGGADDSTLFNCVLTENRARLFGGGAARSELHNCTLIRNSASVGGGAAGDRFDEPCRLYNCIVYHNHAPVSPNYDDSTLDYSCTTPLPDTGTGNIAADPQLASWSHLSSSSPCIGAGSITYASGADIDNEPWSDPPCMGADQFVPGSAIGPLSVALKTAFTHLTVGFAASFRAQIEGQTTASRWTFGDGTVLSNRLELVHAWSAPGVYEVRLTAFNDAYPAGVSATATFHVGEGVPMAYVNQANPNPVFPYSTWATAATNIQDAIGASGVAGRVVWVTNGVYDTGGVSVWGQMTNRIALSNGVVVRSVNGPAVTVIRGAPAPSGTNGDGAIRCAYVGDGSLLDGFTLTNGHTRASGDNSREQGGGGAWCEQTGVVTNCTFLGNEAFRDGGGANGGIFHGCTFRDNRAGDDSGGVDDAMLYYCILIGNQANATGGGSGESTLYNCTLTGNSARYGGGTSLGTLTNCILAANSAREGGGGADSSVLYNCTLTGNSTLFGTGGGATRSTLNNSILYYSSAPSSGLGPNYQDSTLNYCCTAPAPSNGIGNITAEPLFVDRLNGNLRLQSNSPCINAGTKDYITGPTDLDGRPRIVGDTVDMGAYEYQGPGLSEFIGWLQQFGLATDGSADTADADGDRLNNWQEWRCQTDPTDVLSVLRLLPPVSAGSALNVTWQSVAGVRYFLERSTNLLASPPFLLLATNLTGQPGTTTFTDTNAPPTRPAFYRVGVPAP